MKDQEMAYYPIFLNIKDRECVVVGGGKVAERKARSLVKAGAQVKVVSPVLSPGLRRMASAGLIKAIASPFQKDDLKGSFLVIAATNDPRANREVAAEAGKSGILLNVVDRPEMSNFIAPAVAKAGDLVVAISTGGHSPAVARRIRQDLEEHLLPSYTRLLETVSDVRRELKQKNVRVSPQKWQEALSPELMELLEKDRAEVARGRLMEQLVGGNPEKADV